jgi:protein phosphatase
VIRFDQIEQASLTDVGVRRSHNQDNYAIQLAPDEEQWRARGHLFLVADGMGAHAVGEKASEQAARVIPHTYLKYANQGPATALRKAFIEANASIHACGQANREFQGMGTTGTALLLRQEGAWVGHVGDSRVYRIRNNTVEQLSYDHSLVWEYARIKRIDPDEVQDIPANVIHRCLGPEPLVKVDVEGPHPLESGDVFVVCSDGLSGQITDLELGCVTTLLPAEEACRFLVDLANLRGGPDNITVLVVKIKEGPAANGVAGPLPLPRSARWTPIPWWLGWLLIGTLLAATGVVLQLQRIPGSIITFAGGTFAILAGLVGLLLYYRREQQRQVQEAQEEHPQPRIHRRSQCRMQQHLLDKLTRALKTLRQRADEQRWEPDWNTYSQHETLGNDLLAKSDLVGAFREYCRAMLPLTRALQKMRNKEEVFQPVWDKTR